MRSAKLTLYSLYCKANRNKDLLSRKFLVFEFCVRQMENPHTKQKPIQTSKYIFHVETTAYS